MTPFKIFRKARGLLQGATAVHRLEREVDEARLAIGRIEARWVRAQTFTSLRQAEFRVFSQWGEDGIIQYLLGKVPIQSDVFVEFGVEDYSESNTRFLLQNDGWRGVILDARDDHLRFIRERGLDWRYDLNGIQAFVTRENVDQLLRDAGLTGEIGLLSIDVDGNDYWLLEAVTQVSPSILVVEYNSLFGKDAAITIPYSPDFDRTRAHFSNLYYGASLSALALLAGRKGYRLVGSNSVGSNAFFVRSDVIGTLRPVEPAESWIRCRVREGRDERGRLTLQDSHVQGLQAISRLPVVDVRTGQTLALASALSASR